MQTNGLQSWRLAAAGTIVALAAAGSSAQAADMKLSLKGVAIVDGQNLTQLDGTTSQIFKTKIVSEVIGGDFAGQTWGGECWGDGLVVDGQGYTGNYRCSVYVAADEGFTYQVDRDSDAGGDFVITGGKGRFAGATGNGHVAYTWGDTQFGDKLTYTMEGTITLK